MYKAFVLSVGLVLALSMQTAAQAFNGIYENTDTMVVTFPNVFLGGLVYYETNHLSISISSPSGAIEYRDSGPIGTVKAEPMEVGGMTLHTLRLPLSSLGGEVGLYFVGMKACNDSLNLCVSRDVVFTIKRPVPTIDQKSRRRRMPHHDYKPPVQHPAHCDTVISVKPGTYTSLTCCLTDTTITHCSTCSCGDEKYEADLSDSADQAWVARSDENFRLVGLVNRRAVKLNTPYEIVWLDEPVVVYDTTHYDMPRSLNGIDFIWFFVKVDTIAVRKTFKIVEANAKPEGKVEK